MRPTRRPAYFLAHIPPAGSPVRSAQSFAVLCRKPRMGLKIGFLCRSRLPVAISESPLPSASPQSIHRPPDLGLRPSVEIRTPPGIGLSPRIFPFPRWTANRNGSTFTSRRPLRRRVDVRYLSPSMEEDGGDSTRADTASELQVHSCRRAMSWWRPIMVVRARQSNVAREF